MWLQCRAYPSARDVELDMLGIRWLCKREVCEIEMCKYRSVREV